MDPEKSGLQPAPRGAAGELASGSQNPRRASLTSSEPGSKSTAVPHVERQPLGPHGNGKPEQPCHECGNAFTPRHGSGGSKQRFCSDECRMAFHKERQRAQRSSLARLVTGEERDPRKPTITALGPCETGLLDVANCHRTEFVVALADGEAAGTRIETWPTEGRAFMDQHVVNWIEDSKGVRSVYAVTVAAPRHRSIQSCVTILHHSGCDTAGQRTRLGAAYVATRDLAGTGEPAQNETLLSEPAGPARPPWETGTLDIADCERTEFVVALKKGETAGTRIETWPSGVRLCVDQHVSRWVDDNKEKHTIRAMTVAAPKYDGIQSCVVVLHHNPKRHASAESSERGALDEAPPGPRGVS